MTELVTGIAFPNVVVTGIAMTTALAPDAETTWKMEDAARRSKWYP
jgi:beta-ketoacyl ACP synthase